MRAVSRLATTGIVVVALAAVGTVSAIAGEGARAPAPGNATPARQILLRSRVFDPLAAPAEADRAPAGLRANATGGAYLVQFTAAPLDSQRQRLRRLGARIGAYLPEFAYVVRLSAATRAKVAVLPF